MSADLSTLFDVGGIVGGILAGVICDWSGMPAATCVVMLLLAAPMVEHYLYIFEKYLPTFKLILILFSYCLF